MDYQVEVDVIRFDGSLGGNVLLKANWIILGENGKKVFLMDTSSFSEQIDGKGYGALIATKSLVLSGLK
jgi:uncharacterized lipoprotein YmbA